MFKKPVTITDGEIPDPSFDLPVTAGDQLYFYYSAADPALASQITSESVQVSYPGQDPVTVPSALHSATARPGMLPEAYRGWAYVGYNGDGDRATQPVVESDLSQTFSSTSQYDPRTAKAYLLPPVAAGRRVARPQLRHLGAHELRVSSSRLGGRAQPQCRGGQRAGQAPPRPPGRRAASQSRGWRRLLAAVRLDATPAPPRATSTTSI